MPVDSTLSLNLSAGVDEWFIAGTEPLTKHRVRGKMRPKIIYPSPDTVIAVDPDIPDELQRVLFESSSDDPSFRFAIDSVVIGSVPAVSWRPAQGLHTLSLISREGTLEDQITFEVR